MKNRWLVSFSIIFCFVFAPIFQPASALNEVVDIIHVRDLWTAEWTAPNGTLMHGVTGKGVGVAVIDTGIDGTHPDFAGRVSYNAKYVPEIGWIELSDTDLDLGHGTFCSGVFGGSGANSDGMYKGIAPDCNMVGLCAESYARGLGIGIGGVRYFSYADMWIYNNSIKYNIMVVSCSWGEPENDYRLALKNVIERSTLYCYAAGNSGSDGTVNHPDPLGIMSIGASLKDGKIWSWSSVGNKTNSSTWPSVVAPQDMLVSTLAKTGAYMAPEIILEFDPDLLTKQYVRTVAGGTSFTTPQVSGVAALMFQVNPNLTPAQAKQIIELSADPIFGPYNETGWFAGHGLVNGTRAVAVAHYLSLRPNATVDEALEYYRVVRNSDGKIILNPLPFPEIPNNETTNPATEMQYRFIPGFESVSALAGICALALLRRRKP